MLRLTGAAMTIHIRRIQPDDRDAVARLIHSATNRYYESIGREAVFPGPPEDAAVFVDVYDAIDGPAARIAVDASPDSSKTIVGCCFEHARPTHVSLGIMAVHPDHFARGIARQLLAAIIDDAGDRPVRLVSSAINLDSFSLYSRAGFEPQAVVQDVLLPGLDKVPPRPDSVRPATPDDAAAIVAVEQSVTGMNRQADWDYLLSSWHDHWHTLVGEADGQIVAALASCRSAAVNMIGPGAATPAGARFLPDLLQQHRIRFAGTAAVALIPSSARELLASAYAAGGRNVELHLIQTRGDLPTDPGVAIPTFLPE